MTFILFIINFILSFYALTAIDFKKIMYTHKPYNCQIFYFLLALIMGFLLTELCLKLVNYYVILK